MKRKVLCIAIMFFSAFQLFAQEVKEKAELNLGADFMSRYVWRGVDYGRSPSIQLYLAVATGKFEFGAWGAFTTNGLNIQETDLYVTYSFSDALSFTLTNYFFTDDGLDENNYFNLDNGRTGHAVEVLVSYSLPGSIPISITGGTIFYGADKVNYYQGNDLSNDELNYSTYLEFGYSTSISGKEIETFMGLTTHNGLYGDDFGIVNLGITGSDEVKITEVYALPISCSLVFNPQKQNIYIVFGITIVNNYYTKIKKHGKHEIFS